MLDLNALCSYADQLHTDVCHWPVCAMSHIDESQIQDPGGGGGGGENGTDTAVISDTAAPTSANLLVTSGEHVSSSASSIVSSSGVDAMIGALHEHHNVHGHHQNSHHSQQQQQQQASPSCHRSMPANNGSSQTTESLITGSLPSFEHSFDHHHHHHHHQHFQPVSSAETTASNAAGDSLSFSEGLPSRLLERPLDGADSTCGAGAYRPWERPARADAVVVDSDTAQFHFGGYATSVAGSNGGSPLPSFSTFQTGGAPFAPPLPTVPSLCGRVELDAFAPSDARLMVYTDNVSSNHPAAQPANVAAFSIGKTATPSVNGELRSPFVQVLVDGHRDPAPTILQHQQLTPHINGGHHNNNNNININGKHLRTVKPAFDSVDLKHSAENGVAAGAGGAAATTIGGQQVSPPLDTGCSQVSSSVTPGSLRLDNGKATNHSSHVGQQQLHAHHARHHAAQHSLQQQHVNLCSPHGFHAAAAQPSHHLAAVAPHQPLARPPVSEDVTTSAGPGTAGGGGNGAAADGSGKPTKKKRKRCGECAGCQTKNNCGGCAPCKNDRSHQICKMRRCDKLVEKKTPRERGKSGRGADNSNSVRQQQQQQPAQQPQQQQPQHQQQQQQQQQQQHQQQQQQQPVTSNSQSFAVSSPDGSVICASAERTCASLTVGQQTVWTSGGENGNHQWSQPFTGGAVVTQPSYTSAPSVQYSPVLPAISGTSAFYSGASEPASPAQFITSDPFVGGVQNGGIHFGAAAAPGYLVSNTGDKGAHVLIPVTNGELLAAKMAPMSRAPSLPSGGGGLMVSTTITPLAHPTHLAPSLNCQPGHHQCSPRPNSLSCSRPVRCPGDSQPLQGRREHGVTSSMSVMSQTAEEGATDACCTALVHEKLKQKIYERQQQKQQQHQEVAERMCQRSGAGYWTESTDCTVGSSVSSCGVSSSDDGFRPPESVFDPDRCSDTLHVTGSRSDICGGHFLAARAGSLGGAELAALAFSTCRTEGAAVLVSSPPQLALKSDTCYSVPIAGCV